MLILRQEQFGGIIFNPRTASELWVDRALFDAVVATLRGAHLSAAVADAFCQLGSRADGFRLITAPVIAGRQFDFPVLSAPTLIDVNITLNCNLRCPHCYLSAGSGATMQLADYQSLLRQCRQLGVLQIALGGGEPTLHPNFSQFLAIARANDVVPNVTTNGYRLDWRTIYALARHAGAVAVSIEELGERFAQRRGYAFSEFLTTVKKLKAARVRLVFQITASARNLPRLPALTEFVLRYRPYGILFLAYKPQGRGVHYDQALRAAEYSEVQNVFSSIVATVGKRSKLGFDCCLTPLLTGISTNPAIQGCSSARTSMAVMPNLDAVPCSFLNLNQPWGTLRTQTLAAIWQDEHFRNFRETLQAGMQHSPCDACPSRQTCFGGCPIFDLVSCSTQAAVRQPA